MAPNKSPLAPESFPDFPVIPGVRYACGNSGMRYKGRDDVMLAEFDAGTTVAGVFTKNAMPGAPVDWGRKILPTGLARGLVVNAGIANVFTGAAGKKTVEDTATAAAQLLNASPEHIYIASTGVIGDPIPTEKITSLLPRLTEDLSADAGNSAANCILTTDTFAKGAVATAKIGNTDVTIAGFAKGSGMIAPDMATMLAFIFTDAAIPASILQQLLSDANERSFNCVTVDSDTSTSDTALLFATGRAQNVIPATNSDDSLAGFKRALLEVMTDLAQQVARDGEGASKFITVKVTGAESNPSAKTIALAIANSPLVKTAIAGEDANWGRIIMAVGKSGEKADRDKMSLKIGGILIAENGARASSYQEKDVMPHMTGKEIDIDVDVAVGDGRAFAWTCDLTHGYIEINADYRS
ncbi:bifunctional glutamate N-acetyltransferase/amino-acid acetyltransferase ArgJ [Sneathiella sp. CAU 1612]|uniref:Arginine biosynthesis bifunctional protein ArgJ n=1 Tax=Sneathiella sedimenti TaxID=2816034 RepID=A0ABS3F0E4_9PROT|nr:bifunctional glutamate N-acetyltransferase/amino-acid acetyltransferase ArgJ [Sneathiella sedimenti]MBO0331985.1 bifunctional glutamate N-acetyltransferase/amino-acid acetyltransferase ArgJ [Sneathiella sedimenti]